MILQEFQQKLDEANDLKSVKVLSSLIAEIDDKKEAGRIFNNKLAQFKQPTTQLIQKFNLYTHSVSGEQVLVGSHETWEEAKKARGATK